MAKRRAKKPKHVKSPEGKQGSKGKKHKKSFGRRLWDFVRSWGTVIIIVLGIRAFGIESMVVPTGSMEHTILPGDFVIVNKFVYGFKAPFTNKNILGGRMPRKDDIIVFRYPRHPRWARPYDRYRTIFPREFPLLPIHWDTREKTLHWFAPENWVKRCVGVPGDTVEIANKRLFVNSAPFDDYGKATYQEPNTFPRLVPREEFQDRWMDLLVFLYADSLYYSDSAVYKSHPKFGKISFEEDIRLYYDSLFTALFYSGNMPADYFNHYLTTFYLHSAYQGPDRTVAKQLHLPPEGTRDLKAYYDEFYLAEIKNSLPRVDSFFFASYILHYYMRDNFGPIVVPEGCVLGMGDNRDRSNDCRFWGFVPIEMLKGSPLVFYYSLGDPVDGYGNKRSLLLRILSTHWERIGRVVE